MIDVEESDGLLCADKTPLLLRSTTRLKPFLAIV
jgi:hypothetical protein